jgi:RNA polymerase sigma factor (sigma-70 family)
MDAAALEELWRRYDVRLWRFFVSKGLPESAADDLGQELYLKLHHGAGSGQGRFDPHRLGRDGKPVRFRAWLFQCAYNLLVDYLRREGKEPPSFSELETPGGAVDGDTEPFEAQLEGTDWVAEWESVRAATALRRALSACREILDQQEKDVLELWLRSEGAMTYREMAGIMRVKSPSTPHRYLQEVFRKLGECLSRKGYGEYGLADH